MSPEARGLRPELLRSRMVRGLQGRGIDEAVLAAMEKVPRHEFAASGWDLDQAYADTPLPIGYGQTISQPYVVGRMTSLLLEGGPRRQVLEVGTGCGYQTAVLAQVCERVFTIERIAALARSARARLQAMGLMRVHDKHGDGFAGWPEQAPFDGILVAAAADSVPPALIEQLKIGGRLVMPVGPPGRQELLTVDRTGADTVRVGRFDAVTFVPLLPELA